MKSKALLVWGIPSVILIIAIAVGATAAGVGSEASRAKDVLDSAVSSHQPATSVQIKLTALGFDTKPPTATALQATGPHHSLLIYGTWLTVQLNVGPDGNASGYHLDRADHWF